MIANLLVFSGVLAGVMLMTVLYYLLIVACDELDAGQAVIRESNPETDSLYERVQKASDPLRAVIHCASCPPSSARRYEALGQRDCDVLDRAFGGNLVCSNGCLGLGSCAKVCPSDAIELRQGEVFVSAFCTGCGRCVDACPKKLIELVPVAALKTVACASYGERDSNSLCPVALDPTPYMIDYRKFRNIVFK